MLYSQDGSRILTQEEQREEDAFMQVVLRCEATSTLRMMLQKAEEQHDKPTRDMIEWELRHRGDYKPV